MEGVINIESFLGMRQGDLLGSPLFILAHYRALLETIVQVPICVFPSLTDDIHIVEFMIEIACAFDHLSTQITLVGLRAKVSKCKLWSPSRIFPSIIFFQGYTLVIDGLHILGVFLGSQDFAMHFLDEVLS